MRRSNQTLTGWLERFEELAADEILKAVGAAQGEGQCPERLANFDTLDATGKKEALDSLTPSAKARLLPDLLAKDCEHFRLAEIHRGLMSNIFELNWMRKRLLLSYRGRRGICKRY